MISIIVGMDKNRLIGKDNALPWHVKEDLQHFKRYTSGKTVVMGATTYFSIGKALPNRTNIVVCNDQELNLNDAIVEEDLFEVLKKYKNSEEELVVIGGATIYRLSVPYADLIVLTHIKGDYTGDTWFPVFEQDFEVEKEEVLSDIATVKYYRRKK